MRIDMLKGLRVAVVVALVLALAPAASRADGPQNAFVAQGPFVISLGFGIHPAGQSGRFVVPSRRVFGFLGGSVNAPFMIQFATNVPIATQSGNVHGELLICENGTAPFGIPELIFFGCLDPETVLWAAVFTGDPTSLDTASVLPSAVSRTGRVHLVTSLGAGTDLLHPLLNVGGVFTFTEGGTQGNGDVDGFLTLILDEQGHIVGLGDSNLAFCGKWDGPAAPTGCPFQQ